MALAHGRVHYQCPQCKNKQMFTNFSLKSGIYVPLRDAAWEMSEFSDFYGFTGENVASVKENIRKE
jgi:DNA polymerase III alpha subunit (gram-positive type)